MVNALRYGGLGLSRPPCVGPGSVPRRLGTCPRLSVVFWGGGCRSECAPWSPVSGTCDPPPQMFRSTALAACTPPPGPAAARVGRASRHAPLQAGGRRSARVGHQPKPTSMADARTTCDEPGKSPAKQRKKRKMQKSNDHEDQKGNIAASRACQRLICALI